MSAIDDLHTFEKTWPTFTETIKDYASELTSGRYSQVSCVALASHLEVACGEFYAVEHKRLRLAARAEAQETLATLAEEGGEGD